MATRLLIILINDCMSRNGHYDYDIGTCLANAPKEGRHGTGTYVVDHNWASLLRSSILFLLQSLPTLISDHITQVFLEIPVWIGLLMLMRLVKTS